MKFKNELLEAKLIKRYKRFFADIEMIDDVGKKKLLTIHVPNTGSLRGVIEKDAKEFQNCLISLHGDTSKKLAGTLEAVQSGKTWVGVNTSTPNKVVKEAALNSIAEKKPFLKHWGEFKYFKSEIKINDKSRLDGVFCLDEKDLENPKSKLHYIEIKNTTLQRKIGEKFHAQFPDSVTERGEKHLQEMIKLMSQGHRCELIFAIQRSDVDVFSVASDIDPEYAATFKLAVAAGLIVSPLIVELDKKKVQLTSRQLDLVD
jgi:sugar fermentation stimulation protein A